MRNVGKKKQTAKSRPPIACVSFALVSSFLGGELFDGVVIAWDCTGLAAFGAARGFEVGDVVAAVVAFCGVEVDEGRVAEDDVADGLGDGGEGAGAEFVEGAYGDEDAAGGGEMQAIHCAF